MNNQNTIGSIFTFLQDRVKEAPLNFLYIFIASNADVPTVVLTKRKKQIALLKDIALISVAHNYNFFVNLVRTSIVKKTGKTPEMILDAMYRNASRKSIAGIGSISPEDENLLDDVQAKEDELTVEEALNIAEKAWKFLVEIYRKVFPKKAEEDSGPKEPDWKGTKPPSTNNNTTSVTNKKTEAGFGNTLPLVAAAAAVLWIANK